MNSAFVCLIVLSGVSSLVPISNPMLRLIASDRLEAASSGQSVSRVPEGVILVKGASPSASDSVTPLPEDAKIEGNLFEDSYFQMSFRLPVGWTEKYTGPPPSENGRYVLAELTAANSAGTRSSASMLVTAEDLFFTSLPVAGAIEVIEYAKDHLQEDYKVEHPPEQLRLGGRQFSTFTYRSPSADFHWRVLATQIRCHTLEIVLASRDTGLIDAALRDLGTMKLPGEENEATTGSFPVCVKDFARGRNLLLRVDPVLTEHRFNPVPVRIIIDRRGVIRHIHFLSAYPDQARAITDALARWRFKPYIRNGQPVEVETGVLFGPAR
jgi:hypothetical protein